MIILAERNSLISDILTTARGDRIEQNPDRYVLPSSFTAVDNVPENNA